MPYEKGFLLHPRRDLPKRDPSERRWDFREFAKPFPEPILKEQGRRCMDCGVPFCQGETGCPLQNLIPEWNHLAAAGDWRRALDRLHATNNFPEFTGRLCPAPCESACVLGVTEEPVSIKGIEWSVVDRGFQEGWVRPQKPKTRTGHRAAIVGSGPAGLAAAQELARRGHDVTVFEKAPRVGGLLRYGIPDFKMEKHLIDRRVRQLSEEGVRFRTGVRIGHDLSLDALKAEFEVVGLAIGAERPRDILIPGREFSGVCFAMDYLTEQNRSVSGEGPSSPAIDAGGRRVIILGGGDTGSDCLGTALRQGARSIAQFELMPEPPVRRSVTTPWPYWPLQLRSSHAHEEGGQRQWSFQTERFEGVDGRVTSLVGRRLEWQDGRHAPTGEERRIEADLVILALGFVGTNANEIFAGSGVEVDDHGRIRTDTTLRTSREGVFAAGDAHRGASLIVWAIAEGRRMANAMTQYLEEQSWNFSATNPLL